MRNATYPLQQQQQQESQAIHMNHDPNFPASSLVKDLCHRCQQYLDEGGKLTEHLKTCNPMRISTKFVSKENPTAYPPTSKKQHKARVVKSQLPGGTNSTARRAITTEGEIDRKNKRRKQDNTQEINEKDNEKDKEMSEEDNESEILIVDEDMEEVPLLASSIMDSLETLKEYNTPHTNDILGSPINLEDRNQHAWRDSENLFAQTLDSTKSMSSKRRADSGYASQAPSESIDSNLTTASSAAAMYKRKLSGAHDLKRGKPKNDDDDEYTEPPTKSIKQAPVKLNSRKRPRRKVHELEIPPATVFRGNIIADEEKSKPVCARTRSSRKIVLTAKAVETKQLKQGSETGAVDNIDTNSTLIREENIDTLSVGVNETSSNEINGENIDTLSVVIKEATVDQSNMENADTLSEIAEAAIKQTHFTESNGKEMDTLPEAFMEKTAAESEDMAVENSGENKEILAENENIPVKSKEIPADKEKITLPARGRRAKKIVKQPPKPLPVKQPEEPSGNSRLRLRKRTAAVNKMKEEKEKEKDPPKKPLPKVNNKDTIKNISNKKALKINIPLTKTITTTKTTAATIKYPELPSPIHTFTRSKGSKPVDRTQSSKMRAPVEIISKVYEQISPDDLHILDTVLGEGQVGTVNLAKYKGLLVACKSKRSGTRLEPFHYQIQRELKYAADLSVCRYINKYIGWTYCHRYKVEKGYTDKATRKLYVIQKYIPNGDARSYLDGRESIFRPFEAVQAAICLFSALTDAHALGIGIVDLKLENFLIDSSGTGWLTDFGSCIEFYDREEVDLEDEEVAWTTNVAAPEMIKSQVFYKASDVFMATLIVAELLTVELSDKQFYSQVLKRRKNGGVQFSPTLLHKRYSPFFPLLTLGLADKPEDRPSAKDMLEEFVALRAKIIG